MNGLRLSIASLLLAAGCASTNPKEEYVIPTPPPDSAPILKTIQFQDLDLKGLEIAYQQSREVSREVIQFAGEDIWSAILGFELYTIPEYDKIADIQEIFVAVDSKREIVIVKVRGLDINGVIAEEFGIYSVEGNEDQLAPMWMEYLPLGFEYIYWHPGTKYKHFEVNGFRLLFECTGLIYVMSTNPDDNIYIVIRTRQIHESECVIEG